MSPRVARLSAASLAGLLAVSLGFLYVTSHPGLRGTEVQAEFEDAYPILAGMHVRVSGAVAGSVRSVELTDEGRALVTMQLDEGIEEPHQDASAAIRQQDITGDSYVGISPGYSDEPLGDEMIPVERTLVAPRFDDLLNSLDEPVRQGVRILLVELGIALEQRGDDLNRAALRLRPGLEATRRITDELSSQNQVLRALIADAEAVTSQAAGNTVDIERLIDGLERTVSVTAEHGDELDAGLERAPETVRAARGTLARLRRFAVAGLPLAKSLRDSAPLIAEGVELLPGFVDDTVASIESLMPTLRLSRNVFAAAVPTLQAASGSRPLTGPFDLAAGIGELLTALLGDRTFIRSLFGADGYGVGPEAEDDVGLGAVAVDSGVRPGYEGNDPLRRFLRAVAVPSCETFGLPIEEGCLLDFLEGGFPRQDGTDRPAGPVTEETSPPLGGQPAGGESPSVPPAGDPLAPDVPEELIPGLGLPSLPVLPELPGLGGLFGAPGGAQGEGGSGSGAPVNDVLDFLLGP